MDTPSGQAKDSGVPDVSARIKTSLLSHLPEIVAECGASAVFLYVEALGDERLALPEQIADRIVYVARTADQAREQEKKHVRHLRVPNVALARMGQVKLAVFLALARGLVHHGDVIVCVSGPASSSGLDTIVVTEVGREFEMFSTLPEPIHQELPVDPEVLERVVEIAAQLGSEGREGRPVGALFVVGDAERVLSLSRQLILNPFSGYREDERNILDPALAETVKELATVDGAFVIRPDGVIVSAGTYLKTASQDEFELPKGLGARHHAAAGITAVSRAIAVVVSESTGTVTIFRGGRIATSIERPRAPRNPRTS